MSVPFGGELPFVMYQAGTTVPMPGVSPIVEIRKAGSVFTAPFGGIIPVGHGAYCVAANIRDTDTPGILLLSATAAGCDPTIAIYVIAPEVLPNDMRKTNELLQSQIGLLANQVSELEKLNARNY